ncbi:uncharacterized protein LOC128863511 isoform X1 [Anastrepha ludens]|uniref:uncharacterized protein LOC128863511 isoform X1 n=1 Tax=Anastrepha ludens TaxID=28586 RepID=UPI0023B07254|nr:uncharacterized protein LOC128863511 isoform X1 [Anastrepha ludens]XP_053958689.1 uncharacterized protein LOC128863511 isoform X1 [Anastrepha ludens]
MPRQRRTHKRGVDLGSLIDRAQKRNPHIGRLCPVCSRPTQAHLRANKSRSRAVGLMSRNAVIDLGTNGVWNTLVQPVSLLHWFPLRRSTRIRKSDRSQRKNSANNKSKPKIGSPSRMPAAEVQMPCSTLESPTAEKQMTSNHDAGSQQPCANANTSTSQHCTVILHQNPLFDVEGKTRSGIMEKRARKSQVGRVKSKWSVKTTEKQDAAKKTDIEREVPAKKGSSLKDSTAVSINRLNSPPISDSDASSGKFRTDTEESNSYEEGIDLNVKAAPGGQLDGILGLNTAMSVRNFDATVASGSVIEGNMLNERTALLDLTQAASQPAERKNECA